MKTTQTYWNPLDLKNMDKWEDIEGTGGNLKQITIAKDKQSGDYTRLTLFKDGYSTKEFGSKSHEYPEEIFVVSGELYDEAFDMWLKPGFYASRPPYEEHGPFLAKGDVVIFETSYPSQSVKKEIQIKQSIKQTFDSAAKDYDSVKHFEISANEFAKQIDLENTKEIHILDISTGTGNLAIEFAKKFTKANIYAVDISDEMLNSARAKTKNQGIKNIKYLNQDVENLELEDIKFDLITCGYGLFFYPNMDFVFKDICSRLKKDGKFAFSTFTVDAFEPFSKKFLEILDLNYDVKPPIVLESRTLKTKDEIKELCSLVEYKSLDIQETHIRYEMTIEDLWSLFNSAGYKGLLNQLGNRFSKFEEEYLGYLKSIAKNNKIDFNADSYISIVKV